MAGVSECGLLEDGDGGGLNTSETADGSGVVKKKCGIPVDSYDPARKKFVCVKLARFLCGCGIAPDVVDSQVFKDFCKSLNSGYDGLSSSTISFF